jgi:hypothetical protein
MNRSSSETKLSLEEQEEANAYNGEKVMFLLMIILRLAIPLHSKIYTLTSSTNGYDGIDTLKYIGMPFRSFEDNVDAWLYKYEKECGRTWYQLSPQEKQALN